FAETQAILADMEPRFEATGPALQRFLRALPRGAKRPVYLSSQDRDVVFRHRASAGAVAVSDADRLRVLERLAPAARSVVVHASPDGTSAWCVELADARFTLAISAEAWRGFSGEGRLLDDLGGPASRRVVARIASALAWRSSLRADALALEL